MYLQHMSVHVSFTLPLPVWLGLVQAMLQYNTCPYMYLSLFHCLYGWAWFKLCCNTTHVRTCIFHSSFACMAGLGSSYVAIQHMSVHVSFTLGIACMAGLGSSYVAIQHMSVHVSFTLPSPVWLGLVQAMLQYNTCPYMYLSLFHRLYGWAWFKLCCNTIHVRTCIFHSSIASMAGLGSSHVAIQHMSVHVLPSLSCIMTYEHLPSIQSVYTLRGSISS